MTFWDIVYKIISSKYGKVVVIAIVFLTVLLLGSILLGKHIKCFSFEFNIPEPKSDTVFITRPVYKDTCIEKPEKIVYKSSNASIQPSVPINGNNSNVNMGTVNGPMINTLNLNKERRLSSEEGEYLLQYISKVGVTKNITSRLITLCNTPQTNIELYKDIEILLKKSGYEIEEGYYASAQTIQGIDVSENFTQRGTYRIIVGYIK
jgi:hypothetical protein